MAERDRDKEYGMAMVGALELIWGKGFLSPGGPEEVAAALGGRDIEGTEVLDIGCGIGGVDLLLVERFGAARVVGIDVEADNLALARNRAAEKGLSAQVSYRLVEAHPGPFPFPAESFDVVFSKDAIIHIADKEALFADIHRLLRPGGRFIASDWLRADDRQPSPAMERYIASEGLSFAMASPARYRKAMEQAGLPSRSVTAIPGMRRGRVRNWLRSPGRCATAWSSWSEKRKQPVRSAFGNA